VYADDLEPTVIMFTQAKPLSESRAGREGIGLKSVPDLRWARRDIKSVGLLAQVLAKQAASRAGAYEALMVQDGYVTEGGSSSAYIVKDDTVVTRPLSNDILPGITRASLLKLAAERAIRIDERPYTLEEAYEVADAIEALEPTTGTVDSATDFDADAAIGESEGGFERGSTTGRSAPNDDFQPRGDEVPEDLILPTSDGASTP